MAKTSTLPIIRTVQPPDGWEGEAYLGDGPAINSSYLDGLNIADAKRTLPKRNERPHTSTPQRLDQAAMQDDRAWEWTFLPAGLIGFDVS